MAEKVNGYLSQDRKFFETEDEADYHDNLRALKTSWETDIDVSEHINVSSFMNFLKRNINLIHTVTTLYLKINKVNDDNEELKKAKQGKTYASNKKQDASKKKDETRTSE